MMYTMFGRFVFSAAAATASSRAMQCNAPDMAAAQRRAAGKKRKKRKRERERERERERLRVTEGVYARTDTHRNTAHTYINSRTHAHTHIPTSKATHTHQSL